MFKKTILAGVVGLSASIFSLSSAIASPVVDPSIAPIVATDAPFEYSGFGLISGDLFFPDVQDDTGDFLISIDLEFDVLTIYDNSDPFLPVVRDELGFTSVTSDATSITALFEIVGPSTSDYQFGGVLTIVDFDVVAMGTETILDALDRELDDVIADGIFDFVTLGASFKIEAFASPVVVPLPAGGVLLLTAIGGLFLRRRMTA